MSPEPALMEQLTGREREVVRLMARGLTNGQIAEHLGITFETAKWHVSNIISKTRADTREQAVANWRSYHRPVARMRRSVQAWWGLPAVKVSASLAGVAAIAAGALVSWSAFSSGDPGPLVRYQEDLRSIGGSVRDPESLTLSEAVRRAGAVVGVPLPISELLAGRGLLAQNIFVSAGPQLPDGTVVWLQVLHHEPGAISESEPADGTLRVELIRYGWGDSAERFPGERSPFGALGNGEVLAEAPVRIERLEASGAVYHAWGGESRFLYRISDWRARALDVEDVIALVDELVAQE